MQHYAQNSNLSQHNMINLFSAVILFSCNMQASSSNSTNSSTSEKITDLQQKVGDSEIDWKMLAKGEKIASGSSADL